MAFYVSSTAFQQDVLQAPELLPSAGVTHLELSGGHQYYSLIELHQKLTSLAALGVEKFLIHNYFPTPRHSFILNIATPDPEGVARSFALMEEALSLCQEYAIEYYSFHTGYLFAGLEQDGHFHFQDSSGLTYKRALELFLRNFKKLYSLAQKREVRLAIENLFIKSDGTQASLNCSFAELAELLALLPKDVGVLVDLGHLHISSNFLQFDKMEYVKKLVERFSERIFEVHLSANNGKVDEHNSLADDDWQLEAIPLFAGCPGVSGQGVNFTLEARSLPVAELKRNLQLIGSVIC